MKKEIIRLRNVHKNYKMGTAIVRAVNDVNLSIKQGDFIAIVGPSGSGKSTLMNLVGALDIATTGAIYLDGENIEHMHESELASIRGKKIGFVFQTFNLVTSLTALENVMLPMLFQDSISMHEKKERAKNLLEEIGLKERMHHLPNEMSGGEQQRVAIARALANDPEVILADEPTGNLDSKTGKSVLKILKDLNKKGKTIIVVTHNLEMAREARKIIRVKDGRIVNSLR